ncbi:MAG: gamma-glutamyl-gamma-aminobutyrate hydrolase family protein [Pseudomonadota bacterium]
MRPLIGITCDYDSADPCKFWLREEYAAAVLDAGGMPVLLAPLVGLKVGDIAGKLNGFVITGGDFDIEPHHYGEAPLPGLGKLNPRRSGFELELIRWAFSHDLPVLGICGGMQTINVAFGGTLYQDISTQFPGASLNHEQGRNTRAHKVNIKPNTLLADLLRKTEAETNSSHHQGVKEVAPGLRVSGTAPDGIIEAIENKDSRFMLGLQWHPESLYVNDKIWLKVFEGLVVAA